MIDINVVVQFLVGASISANVLLWLRLHETSIELIDIRARLRECERGHDERENS